MYARSKGKMDLNAIKKDLLNKLNGNCPDKYKETWSDGEKFQLAESDDGWDSNGLYIYPEENRFVCDIKWWANKDQNVKLGLQESCYNS
jgi:hypothetical protein